MLLLVSVSLIVISYGYEFTMREDFAVIELEEHDWLRPTNLSKTVITQ